LIQFIEKTRRPALLETNVLKSRFSARTKSMPTSPRRQQAYVIVLHAMTSHTNGHLLAPTANVCFHLYSKFE
jgi:hypothetical protein